MISSGKNDPKKADIMDALIKDPHTTTSELTDFMLWAIKKDDYRSVMEILRVSGVGVRRYSAAIFLPLQSDPSSRQKVTGFLSLCRGKKIAT
jgi:hypothetical protein